MKKELFLSHILMVKSLLSPEKSIQIQRNLGADLNCSF